MWQVDPHARVDAACEREVPLSLALLVSGLPTSGGQVPSLIGR
jgi:hypothetical protein